MEAAEKFSTELGTAPACRAFGVFLRVDLSASAAGRRAPQPNGPAHDHIGH